MKPVIIGCRTDHFSEEQISVFKQHQPIGMIIFAEPFQKGPDTARHVIAQFKEACPGSFIFIDAEGGRVNRMQPSYGHGWRDIPAPRSFAPLIASDIEKAKHAIYLGAQLIANDLMTFGITVNCAPVIDLVSTDVISKKENDGKPHATSESLFQRSFSDDPYITEACARAFLAGLNSRGVQGVVKHVPGYGRVSADPHYAQSGIETSVDILEKTDFEAFRLMNDTPLMMTGHVIYTKIDPDRCSTMSPVVMKIIRDSIGFKGVIIADTIEMNATMPDGFSKTEKDQFGMGLPLPGTLTLVTKAALAAGCDVVMHSDCSRIFAHTVEVLEAAPVLSPEKTAWMIDKLSISKPMDGFDAVAAEAELQSLLSMKS